MKPRTKQVLGFGLMAFIVVTALHSASAASVTSNDCEILKANRDVVLPKISIPPDAWVFRESRVPPNGSVVVTLKVDDAGNLQGAAIAETSNEDILDEAVLGALQKASYKPGTIRNTRSSMCYQMRFSISFSDGAISISTK